MPQTNTGRANVNQAGKTTGKQTTKAAARRVTVAPADRVTERVDRRQRQIAASRSASPDRQDTKRSPAQQKRDTVAVATNVRQARQLVVEKQGRGAGARFVARVVTAPIRIQQGPVKNLTAKQAAEARAQGKKVTTTKQNVGASLGVKTFGQGPVRAGTATVLGLAQDPKHAIPATAKGFRDALTGIPSGIAALITDPVGTAKSGAKDYGRRYGGINEPGGVNKMADRVSKEGAAAELLDAVGIATASGAGAGRALGTAARAGKLGEKAERIANDVRPDKRVSGGQTVEQEKSPNLITAAAQTARDNRRVEGNRARVARDSAEGKPVDAVKREAAVRGEVPARRREAARAVAKEKGRDLERMKREQRVEVDKGTRRNLAGLSKKERAGFKFAMQLGIPGEAKLARAALEKRFEDIANAREKEGVTVPKVLAKSNDELAIIANLLKGDLDQVFTPRLREVVKAEQSRERRLATNDPGLDPVQSQLRRYMPQAAHLGIERGKGESNGDFLRRVKRAAADAGLKRPGYFVSQKRPRAGNADRAIGGTRAIASPKAYTGALFRTGREDTRPEVFEQGIAKNIKRKYNWNRVAQNFDEHAFEWGRNTTVNKLLDELDHRGIDPESVALWNPRLYRAERAAREDDPNTDFSGRGEDPAPQGLGEAVDAAATTIKDLATRPEDFKKAGWSVIPRAVYDEIHTDTRPSGVIARGWDIAKGKQSRILLGLSPAWLQFQVASNALLSGLAGTGPVDLVKAQVWWSKLPEAQKAAIEPYIGTGAFHDSIGQTKLGAARTRSAKVNDMIDAYRALKTTPFMQQIGRGNPLDLLFRADAAQNNAFRRGVLYSQVKRDAYKRMGQNTKAMAGLQTRFMHTLNLGPQKIMDELVSDQRSLERHAQHVNDFLGDYSTFTAAERRGFQRAVMFYGFLRYSLRFTFLTMPLKHPVMSSVVAQLGRLQVDEVRKLLGGDELPFALGKLYFTKNGQLKSVDLSRANPAMNAITNFRGPKDVLGFLPPIVGAVIDQAYAKSGFKQKDFRVEGENQGRTSQQGYGVENRVRIFLGQMLALAAPYRTAMNATQPGPKGDDSLLFSPRPTQYKDPQTLYSIAASQANKPKTELGRAVQDLVPFIPRNDDAPELAASIRARNGQQTDAAPRSVAPATATPTVSPEVARRMRLAGHRGGSGPTPAEIARRQRLATR